MATNTVSIKLENSQLPATVSVDGGSPITINTPTFELTLEEGTHNLSVTTANDVTISRDINVTAGCPECPTIVDLVGDDGGYQIATEPYHYWTKDFLNGDRIVEKFTLTSPRNVTPSFSFRKGSNTIYEALYDTTNKEVSIKIKDNVFQYAVDIYSTIDDLIVTDPNTNEILLKKSLSFTTATYFSTVRNYYYYYPTSGNLIDDAINAYNVGEDNGRWSLDLSGAADGIQVLGYIDIDINHLLGQRIGIPFSDQPGSYIYKIITEVNPKNADGVYSIMNLRLDAILSLTTNDNSPYLQQFIPQNLGDGMTGMFRITNTIDSSNQFRIQMVWNGSAASDAYFKIKELWIEKVHDGVFS